MTDIKTRDKSVDFAKGIAMIAVSFGHIMPVLYGNVDIVSKYCYSFELAVFFIVSGYLQFGRTERKPIDYIRHSASSLLYPYAVFTAVLFFIGSLPTLIIHGINYYIQGLPLRVCSIVTWGAGACWFFPTFFIAGIIAYFSRRSVKIPSIAKTVFLIIAGSIMCVIAEKYGYLKDVTEDSITIAPFWIWHLFSLISRSIVGASLIMVGYEIKRYMPKSQKISGGGTCYLQF